MFSGVLALLERSLRVDSRAWGPHLARFGLMFAIDVAVSYASATSSMFGAPGLLFFRSIAYLNLVFMTLMGIGYFSTAITEEKEEDTLGLMLMAGISPLGLLLGKSGGRLVQALLLIAVQYPFTLLAVTLGGITTDQVRSTYVAMIAYMIMLAGVGLLCSTLARRSRSASMWLTLSLLAYFAIPSFCQWSFVMSPFVTRLDWIAQSCVFLQMGTILSSGFHETLWSYQVVTNLSIGGLGYVLSWALFGLAVRDPSVEASTRGMVARSRSSARLFSPGRPMFDPFVWKDFYFVAGGVAGTLIRISLYVSLYFVAVAMAGGLFGGGWGSNTAEGITGCYLALTMFAIAIDAGLLVSRSLHEEVRGQTLAALLMLPTSTGMILYGKIIGSLLSWLPGPACLLFGTIVLPYGPKCTADFLQHPGPPFWLVTHLILVPHAAALAAMIVRWGALPLAIGISFGSAFLTGLFFNAIRVHDDSPVVWFVGFAILGACGACHFFVWQRAEALSAR